MITRADITPLGIAAVTATAAGIMLGVWASPPAGLAEPAFIANPGPITADDPNLAAYKRMIAEQGGPGPLYLVTAYQPVVAAPVEADPADLLDAQIARDAADFDQRATGWEAERTAWLDAHRAEQRSLRPLPVAYVETEPARQPAFAVENDPAPAPTAEPGAATTATATGPG